MGTIQHNAIVVVGDDYTAPIAHERATELGLYVTPLGPVVINGYQSFLVCPDGSKEGWGDSDKGDELRDMFVEWLREWNLGTYIEVSFGEYTPTIVRSSYTDVGY